MLAGWDTSDAIYSDQSIISKCICPTVCESYEISQILVEMLKERKIVLTVR